MNLHTLVVVSIVSIFYGILWVCGWLVLAGDLKILHKSDSWIWGLVAFFWPVSLWLYFIITKSWKSTLPTAKDISKRRSGYRWGTNELEYWRGFRKQSDGSYKFFRK